VRIAVTVVVALCFEAPWCFAGAESISVPILETRELRGGDQVVIRWGAFKAGVEEFELLLSTDGGRSYLIRVSPELEGHSIQYAWRVPNVSAAEARVRIRARIDGREINGPPSAVFTLARDPDRPAERWLFREAGGWGEQEEPSRAPFNLRTPERGRSLGTAHSVPWPDAPIRIGFPIPTLRFQPRPVTGTLAGGGASGAHHAIASRFHPLRE
jgi:hypothetical protein